MLHLGTREGEARESKGVKEGSGGAKETVKGSTVVDRRASQRTRSGSTLTFRGFANDPTTAYVRLVQSGAVACNASTKCTHFILPTFSDFSRRIQPGPTAKNASLSKHLRRRLVRACTWRSLAKRWCYRARS